MARRNKSKPPSAEELNRKLDSMRPGSERPEPLAPEDVTGVIDLALERLQIAQEHTESTLHAAAERLLNEAERTRAFARRVTDHPPKKT